MPGVIAHITLSRISPATAITAPTKKKILMFICRAVLRASCLYLIAKTIMPSKQHMCVIRMCVSDASVSKAWLPDSLNEPVAHNSITNDLHTSQWMCSSCFHRFTLRFSSIAHKCLLFRLHYILFGFFLLSQFIWFCGKSTKRKVENVKRKKMCVIYLNLLNSPKSSAFDCRKTQWNTLALAFIWHGISDRITRIHHYNRRFGFWAA